MSSGDTNQADASRSYWCFISYRHPDNKELGLASPPLQHQDKVISASVSPDGKWVVTAAGSTARVWFARTGQPVSPPLQHGVTADKYKTKLKPNLSLKKSETAPQEWVSRLPDVMDESQFEPRNRPCSMTSEGAWRENR